MNTECGMCVMQKVCQSELFDHVSSSVQSGYRVPHKMYGEGGKIPRDRRPSRGYSKWSSGGATGQLDALTCFVTSVCLLMYVNWR